MDSRAGVVALLAVGLLAEPAGLARQAAPPPSPRNASYVLQATLDQDAHTIQASGRLTWRNISHIPAADLRFHLYWNAWRDNDSSWMREQRLGRNPRLAARLPEDRGAIDLSRLAVGDGDNLLQRARFIAPDDGNALDRTVLSVPLDRPVAPGETITVDLAWSARVPRTFSRTGRLGDYYFIAQWFPKIGVLEDTGWNCHQFHAATEFFADFGTYDVSLTVPAGWIVGATGRETSVVDAAGGRRTHRFQQDDVHDFAWTTSPDFVEMHDTLDVAALPKVDIRLLLQPEHVVQAGRHFTATRAALTSYGTWFGAYPYDHITVVDPPAIVNAPTQGESTGGMEYPTLFTAGTRYIAPPRGLQPESVTIHEAGHQFWYGLVATNEFEHAWMDEGFNTYSTARVIAEALPPHFVAVDRYFGGLLAWPYEDVAWSRAVDGNRLNAYRPVATADRQSTPTWRYYPGTASAITYNKTALWLATLERMVGWDTVRRILSTYFERGEYRHPSPDEFFAVANEASGQDLTWFFDAVYRSSAAFDYAVGEVTTTPAGADVDTVVVVRRLEDGVFPVDVRVSFEDGTSVTERWDGRDRWRAFHYRRAVGAERVEVDPDRVLLLDLNYTNNSWSSTPHGAAAAHRWSMRWLTWLEEVMLTYAFFS